MMPTQHQLRRGQQNKTRGRPDEDPAGIMAEMSLLMAPPDTVTKGMVRTTPNKTKTEEADEEVSRRIRKGKHTAKALLQAKKSSDAAVDMSKSELRQVMRRRGLSVSKDTKKDVESLINSFYAEAENELQM
jgi:hypothetical protein